jgi:hypothetical protein
MIFMNEYEIVYVINVSKSFKCSFDTKYTYKNYATTKGLWALLEHLVIQGVPGESAMRRGSVP